MIKVRIYYASGYMGGEAIRILLEHPEVEIGWITSRGTNLLSIFIRTYMVQGLNL